VQDHARNRAILEEIKARDPSGRLMDLRNRIFDFTKRELETRNKASIRNELLQSKIVPHGDEQAINALVKDVRRENKLMTSPSLPPWSACSRSARAATPTGTGRRSATDPQGARRGQQGTESPRDQGRQDPRGQG
jgi:hypothetical protein